MSYTYLLEQEEESSAASFLGIPAYVLSRLNLTAAKSCFNGNGTASCQSSPSGMMSEPLTESRGEGALMPSAPESHANGLAPQAKAADFSIRITTQPLSESFARFDPQQSCWKTPHFLFTEDLAEFSGTWPHWGLMRAGECWELPTQERPIGESEFGFWPTPSGVKGAGHCVGAISEWGGSSNIFRGTSDRNLRCPDFEEWMMGWPESWTALTPLGTDKFQAWLHSHGRHSAEGRS
jgi:hypothetical protein